MMTDIKNIAEKMVNDCPKCWGYGHILITPSQGVWRNIEEQNKYNQLYCKINWQKLYLEGIFPVYHQRDRVKIKEENHYKESGIQKCWYCSEMRELLSMKYSKIPKEVIMVNEQINEFNHIVSEAKKNAANQEQKQESNLKEY